MENTVDLILKDTEDILIRLKMIIRMMKLFLIAAFKKISCSLSPHALKGQRSAAEDRGHFSKMLYDCTELGE